MVAVRILSAKKPARTCASGTRSGAQIAIADPRSTTQRHNAGRTSLPSLQCRTVQELEPTGVTVDLTKSLSLWQLQWTRTSDSTNMPSPSAKTNNSNSDGKESTTIKFEWTLRDLKNIFDKRSAALSYLRIYANHHTAMESQSRR